MDQDKKQDIALMRYSAIAPIISGLDEEYVSLSAYFRDVAAKGIKAPDGSIKHFAATTIEKWYLSYKHGGFEALVPASRTDVGVPRKLDSEVQERIRYFKQNYPRMSAAAIHRQLNSDGATMKGEVSESTVNRFVKQLELEQQYSVSRDMRRYERPHINEVWCADTCVGPYLKTDDGKKHKVYIIAMIDDASRFITGIDVFFNDNFINLMSVMKSAVAKYGRPKVWNVDNGPGYRNKQMELVSARIGSVVHYCHPYSPTEKSKIERWFRTLRDSWMASLDIRDFHSLDELRGSLMAFVKTYNNSPHSSLGKISPSDRFFSEPEFIKRPDEESLDTSFLLEIERRVSADSVVMIDQVEYEVDFRFAKQRIRLRYSPDMSRIFIVESDGSLSPIRLLNKHENSFVKREKVHLCRGEES